MQGKDAYDPLLHAGPSAADTDSAVARPNRPGRKPREKLKEDFVLGLREIAKVQEFLDTLRQRYPHPNRVLFFNDLLVALLLAFFNPVARSLRGIEDASQTPGVREHLDIDALHRSTVSDAMALFDPQLLDPLVAQIRRSLPDFALDNQDPSLRGLLNRLRVFDGSYFRLAADVSWAIQQRHGRLHRVRGQVRLNLHLAACSGMISGITISGQGDPSEPQALLVGVAQGDVVVADRGCFSHDTVHELLQAKADMVLRLTKAVACTVISERPLTQEDRDQGILSDQAVLLTGDKNPHEPVPMRLVTIRPDPAGSTRGKDPAGPPEPPEPQEPIRLLTSITDETAAWVIAYLYRRRWDIELFFRWLKTCAQWEHLLSHSKNGVLLQFYIALIGTMLLACFSGRKPDKYSHNLMVMAAAGMGTMADMLPIYERRMKERDRARERQRERNAAKKKA